MTRVLHSLNLIIPGGVERTRLSLLERLPASYRHLAVCVEIQDHEFASELRRHLEDLVELGPIRSVLHPARYRTAASVVATWQPDVVHGAIIEGYTVASIAGRWKRAPVVIMEETSDPRTRSRKGHMLARSMAALADHCIAVSPGIGRYLTDYLRIPAAKVSVINNGVEKPATPTPDQLAELRERYDLPLGQTVIGSVARMDDDSVKRFADLLTAFAVLANPDLCLLLVGDGRERHKLESLATELGIAHQVRFVGFQKHPGHFYALMDIFALASEREAFGLVNAEAMRCGVPVVATRVGGIPDVVQHERTGLLVPPRVPTELADALRTLIDDPHLRMSMGAAGRAYADKHFSAERYVADVHNLYQRLLC